MKNTIIILSFLLQGTILCLWILLLFYSCKAPNETKPLDKDSWKLGWQMIENSWNENNHLAEMQFDTLLSLNQALGTEFLINGLKIKAKLSKEEEILKILAKYPKEIQNKICEQQFAKELKVCLDLPKEDIENKKLQLEIIEMYVNDQSIRGNLMKGIISKYDIDTTKIIERGEILIGEKYSDRMKEILSDYGFSDQELAIINNFIDNQEAYGSSVKELTSKYDLDSYKFSAASMLLIDERNRNRLKEIIKEFDFPTTKLIGKDAMRGVFLIIQHADADKEWQQKQLKNIELGTKTGDFNKQDYAYLYDRIQVNSGKKQRYGSQFSKVDKKNKITELKDTEDLDRLDERRRKMGMMPIEMYKRLMLRN